MNARAVAACVLLPLAVVCARMFYEGNAALAEADRASSQAARVALLGKAARRALPFGPSAHAREALAALGRSGVPGAWAELRGAILATRSFYTPSPQLLDEANHAIADRRARADAVADIDEHRAFYLEQLEHLDEPSRPLALLALLGLLAFLSAAARLFARGVAAAPVAVGVLGFVLFIVGLWRA